MLAVLALAVLSSLAERVMRHFGWILWFYSETANANIYFLDQNTARPHWLYEMPHFPPCLFTTSIMTISARAASDRRLGSEPISHSDDINSKLAFLVPNKGSWI